ncbi:serine/threonine-protein kinase PRP4 homolog [Embiotoca jacksoni]|uniref:serine/threonine-protein kinase PRP4 homolog n=1 Tax=Embiotoca jacksoni TaxID=100190 RepID=UPI0037037B87
MYSNRSEYGHRRQHGDRSSRQWDEYEDRRKPHRDAPRDPYHKYAGEGRGSAERTSRSREYSGSPYGKDSSDRDRSRMSPARRRASPPVRDDSENKWRRLAEDDEKDYRYRCEENTYRQSADSFSHAHRNKEFKDTPPREENFQYRKTPQDSRHGHRNEEFTYMQRHDESTYGRSSGCYKDRDGRERSGERSQERTRSQDRSTKNYIKPREKTDSPPASMYPEDYHQSRTRFTLSGSNGQSFESDATTQSASVPEEKSAKGFQRFLDVLNKGVNVNVLTKVLSQTCSEVDDRPPSPRSFTKPAARPCSPGSAERGTGSHQNKCYWSESEGSLRRVSPEPRQRSLSPQRRPPPPEEKCPQDGGDGRSCRSKSPPVAEKATLTPEDERKRRQMQDVLQAIGMDLGFEELGQMSHRIRERLYGKKESKASQEGGARPAPSPRRRSRSSSSRSTVSPLAGDRYSKNDSYGATEAHRAQPCQSDEYGGTTSSGASQDAEKSETNSQESTAALQTFSTNPAYAGTEPPAAPVMPTYSPVSCSLPYAALSPALPPALRPVFPPAFPPALPPVVPPFGPGLFVPHLPPFLPHPRAQPLNVFPTTPFLPPHLSNPPLFNLPNINTFKPVYSTQKSKPAIRRRCLQVIETKQPG